MRALLSVFFCLSLLAAYSQAMADSAASSAFDTLKSLRGRWSITSGSKRLAFPMTYDVGSKGSIVTETFGQELSVFYRNGNTLLMTHYCNVGNQPRLRLDTQSPAGELHFVFFDITGLISADDPHVQQVTYRFPDRTHIALEIVWAGARTERYSLAREPAGPGEK